MKNNKILDMIICVLTAIIAIVLAHNNNIFDAMTVLVLPIGYFSCKRGFLSGILCAVPEALYLIYYHLSYVDAAASGYNIGSLAFKLFVFATIVVVGGNLRAKYDQTLDAHVKTNDSLSEILDALDEQVMISEKDSDVVLVANAQMCKMHGLPDDYAGKPCFETLYGKTARCEFCRLHEFNLQEKGEHVYWDHFDQKTGKWFRDIDTLISWHDGRLVRLQQTVDITASHLSQMRMARRLELQGTLQQISQMCISFTNLDELVQNSLELYGKSLGVDRVSVVQLVGEGDCVIRGCYDQKHPVTTPYDKTMLVDLRPLYEYFSKTAAHIALREDFHDDFTLINIERDAMHDFGVAAIYTQDELSGFVIAMNYDDDVPRDSDTLFASEMYSKLINEAILRNRSERIADEAKARLIAMINAMPMAGVFYDTDGNPIFCNQYAADIALLDSPEDYITHFYEVMPEYQPNGRKSREWSKELILETFETGESKTFEWIHCEIGGREVPTEVTLERVNWIDGSYRVVAYTRSLEETKAQMKALEETHQMLIAAKEDAERSAQAKTEFMAKMSHEIRTPLNAIFSLSHLLSIAEQDPIKQGYLQNVLLASDSLLHIINDILDFSKIDAAKVELTLDEYSLLDCITDAIKLNTVKSASKDISFVTKIPPTLPQKLYGDENKIQQIISNFLSNAVKYTPEGTVCLSVDFEIDGEFCDLRISVTDTGIGIREDEVDKLPLAFYQADRHANRNIQGTGLGLSICKGLADAIGGKIEIESEYGVGSTFTLVLQQPILNAEPLIPMIKTQDRLVLIMGKGPVAQNMVDTMETLAVPYELSDPDTQYDMLIRSKKYTHIFYWHEDNADLPLWIGEGLEDVSVTMIKKFSNLSDDYMKKRINILFQPIMLTDIVQIINTGGVRVRATAAAQDISHDFTFEGVTALVVDDNDTNLIAATELMKKYGVQSDTAESGEIAVEMTALKNYDIIFMDHMMTGIDGVEATAIIRTQNDWNSTVPVVALTANALAGMREFFLENKFDDFLSKPIVVDELEQILLNRLPQEKLIISATPTSQSVVESNAMDIITALCDSEQLEPDIALERTGLSADSYIKVLTSVYRSIPDYIEKLARFHGEDGDLLQFQIAAHAQKSALANVGAQKQSKYAKTLEDAARNQDMGAINSTLPEYFVILNKLEKLLSQTLQGDDRAASSAQKTKRSLGEISGELLEIKDLVFQLEHDIVLERLESITAYSYGHYTDEMLYQLSTAIDNYDVDKAAELIDLLASQG